MKIDSPGAYRGTVTESTIGLTKKSGYPQWIARFKAEQKFVESPEELKHFGLEEPDWVDWSQFNEDIVGYLVLFNSSEEYSPETAMLNYDQLQIATGWDGESFDDLANGTLIGKKVLFRVDPDEYNGNVSLKVNWVDDHEASPVRELRAVDSDTLADLNSRLKVKKAVKPASKPAKPAAAKPAATKPGKSASGAGDNPATAAPPAVSKPGTTAKPSAPPVSKPSPSPESETPSNESEEAGSTSTTAASESDEALPNECSQGEAWDYVIQNKGDNGDKDVEEAWIAACNEVLELAESAGRESVKGDEDFTDEDWAKVRDIVRRDLILG